MIVRCQKCQKKHKFDPAKLKSSSVAFKCKNCGHRVSLNFEENHIAANDSPSDTASGPPLTPGVEAHNEDPFSTLMGQTESEAPGQPPKEEATAKSVSSSGAEAHNEDPFSTLMAQTETEAPVQPSNEEVTAKPVSRKRYGLKVKMLGLFFVIPLTLVVIASTLFLWQLDTLTGQISVDSHAMVAKLSQERVNDMARMVANQCKLYLDAHPYLAREDFNKNAEFRELALQKVGETGYTCIYEIPDSAGKSGVWVHPNETIIGIDLPPAMQKAMGHLYQAWMTVYQGAYKGETSSGYYKWEEKDGSLRDKYMTCTPVKGTPYVVAATTYVDEINREAKALKTTAEKMTEQTRYIVFAVFGVTILLMGSTVLFYSGRLRNNLAALTEAAGKISAGDLNTKIQVRSNDEISDLGEAIGLMQESIRLSLERLRRRR